MAPRAEFKFSTYQRKLKLINDNLNHIKEAIEPIILKPPPLPSADEHLLRRYQKETQKHQDNFETLLNKVLEEIEETDAPASNLSSDQTRVQDLVTLILSSIEAALPLNTPTTPSHDGSFTGTSQSSTTQVRLPKLELKNFNGRPEHWTSFINLFDVAVHKCTQLSNVNKFQYLLGVLSGEPLRLVSSLNITSANYIIAYDLLKARYFNPRRLTALHLNHLIDLAPVSHTSPQSIRQLITSYYEHSEALKALECDVTSESNPILATLLLRKLDDPLRRKLEMYRTRHHHIEHSTPELSDIMKFLNEECSHSEDASLGGTSGLQRMGQGSTKPTAPRPAHTSDGRHYPPHKNVSMVSTSIRPHSPPSTSLCFACDKGGHKIYSCPVFQNQSTQERHALVKTHHRCYSCLGNHAIAQCNSKARCFKCQQKHHTLLHFEKTQPSPSTSTQRHGTAPSKDLVSASAQHSPDSSLASASSTVLLGTTLVKLTASNGNSQVFRALLDSGSMVDFITERAAQLLRTPRRRATHSIVGISQTSAQTKGITSLDVSPLKGRLIASNHDFHILEHISADLPRSSLSPEVLRRVKPYNLADPHFDVPGGIDVLLGGALLPTLLTNEVHSLGHNLPHVIGTRFGFVVMGKAPCSTNSSPLSCVTALLSTADVDLHNSLRKFWELEEPPSSTRKTSEEQLCDEHFDSTHSRTDSGRYVVRLPFKKGHPPLGFSRLAAERRFFSLENKFKTQPRFKTLYLEFMDDYLSCGHMTKLDSFDCSSPHYFLPHHGVLKESSSTTKLRTVFDASCKTSTGSSLNDVLLTGRKLQNDICDILVHFRMHRIVFTCDIRQMYRQILVHPEDQKYQLILWRDNSSKPIEPYKLNTVVYGLNSSPYLALRTLQQLAFDEGEHFPAAAQILQNHTYVDDIISGADSVEAAVQLQQQLISLLKKGGFELRKWSSNSPQLLQSLPQDHLETPVFLQESHPQPHVTILGLHWSPEYDAFSYKLSLPRCADTKRQVLSTVAQIYDPCGYLAPTIMWAKCFLQLLWTSNLSWDDPLPTELHEQWQRFMNHVKALTSLQIPRNLHISDAQDLELHGFCDASENGYAAVLYIKSSLKNGSVTVRLLVSKTRVAPLKKVTLPRLELCGAHLLGQLAQHCLSLFPSRLNANSTYLWCDSSVVLTWLQTPSYKLKTFVANRVAQTQELFPPQCWRHVSSAHNPADCASRGILASQLIDHPLWWTGPEWLSLPSKNWPQAQFSTVPPSELDELKLTPVTALTSTSTVSWDLLEKFSSWSTLKCVMAYVLRFIANCRNQHKHKGPLSISELQAAQRRIFKLIQDSVFSDDLTRLQKELPPSTRLQRLSPFIDSQGLLRVGGRLAASPLHDDVRHPVILPSKHPAVDLLIDFFHKTHLHAGPQLTQALLSRQVWILSARSTIRSRIFKCIRCFRVKPRNQAPLMGDLPPARVTPARPFLHTAMDFAGPITTKMHTVRSIRHIKCYLCIFICLVTKAVHLEIVTDLTSEAFIAALTRFVSRRGLCSDLYSDCGTNFVGAEATLHKIVRNSLFSSPSQAELLTFGAQKGITFHFNPPAAPHQGGLWESAVKSAKHHLRRVMGEVVLTLPGLMTLTTQIEAMLNSRPLTPLSNDPADLAALTPGHFLIGAPLAAVPEPALQEQPLNRLKHWQLVQALHQRIWQRWQLEYLHTLQQRAKWTKRTSDLRIDDLVLVHNQSPPLTWPLARVTALHPGKDGVVRVVDLKTAKGCLTRPAVKVFSLPLE